MAPQLRSLAAILGFGALFLAIVAIAAMLTPGRPFADVLMSAVGFLTFAALLVAAAVGTLEDRTRE